MTDGQARAVFGASAAKTCDQLLDSADPRQTLRNVLDLDSHRFAIARRGSCVGDTSTVDRCGRGATSVLRVSA
eukprot:857555-Pleurochrysis_carterae.AAC.4